MFGFDALNLIAGDEAADGSRDPLSVRELNWRYTEVGILPPNIVLILFIGSELYISDDPGPLWIPSGFVD
jgi:hypothetical protein